MLQPQKVLNKKLSLNKSKIKYKNYRLMNRRHTNHVLKLTRHIGKHPNDKHAVKTLKNLAA